MKYKKVNLEKIADAVYEFENTTQPYEEIREKIWH